MRTIEDFDILILPGWRGSGPEHWQTHWQAVFPAMRRVEQADWERPVYADWARNLSAAVINSRKPVVLVAHSLANALVARWSQDADTRGIAGAFMVATSDINRFAGTPEFTVYGFDPLVLRPLPFPAMVLSSRDDERVAPERARQFAVSWGARFVDLGERGHVGSAANLGLWPQGLVLFGQFIAALGAL